MTAQRRAVSSSRGCATSGLLPKAQIGRCADKLADNDARKRTALRHSTRVGRVSFSPCWPRRGRRQPIFAPLAGSIRESQT
jgi:hypothetical protein